MKLRSLSGLGQARRGATAVEFALVVGPMILVLMGIAEFGRFFWTAQSLQRVATRAARCVGLLQSDCAAAGSYNAAATISYVQAQALDYGILLPATSILTTNSTACAGVTGFSSVQITYSFVSVAPNLIPGFSASAPLNAKACFPNQA